jgi:hypothetical protein
MISMQKSHVHHFYSSSIVTKMILLLTLALFHVLLGITIVDAYAELQGPSQIPASPQRIVVFPLFAEEMLLGVRGRFLDAYHGQEYAVKLRKVDVPLIIDIVADGGIVAWCYNGACRHLPLGPLLAMIIRPGRHENRSCAAWLAYIRFTHGVSPL